MDPVSLGESAGRLLRLAAEIAGHRPIDTLDLLTAASRERPEPWVQALLRLDLPGDALVRGSGRSERVAPSIGLGAFRINQTTHEVIQLARYVASCYGFDQCTSDLLVLALVLVPESSGGAAIRSGGASAASAVEIISEAFLGGEFSDLDAAVKDFYRDRRGTSEPRRKETPTRPRSRGGQGQSLMETVYEFLTAEHLSDLMRVIEERPDILSDAADRILQELFDAAAREDDTDTQARLAERRYLLSRLRPRVPGSTVTEPITEAAPEAAPDSSPPPYLSEFLECGKLSELRLILESNPQLLSEEVEARLARHVASLEEKGMTETARFVDGHRQFLTRCRQLGLERGLAEAMRQDPEGLGTRFLRIKAGMIAFGEAAEAKTWREAAPKVLAAYPELLSDDADRVLEEGIATIGGEHGYRLRGFQLLLARCREAGLDEAFAEMQAARSGELADAVVTFLNAGSDDDAKAVVDTRPELLGYAVQFLLSERIADAAGAQETRLLVPFLEEQQHILAKYREMESSRSSGEAQHGGS